MLKLKILKNLLLVAMLFVLISCGMRGEKPTNEVCFEGQCVDVELATTFQERSIGLQFRGSLKKGNGMLFVFPQSGFHVFWMKDTYIPLDIIWLDRKMKIVHIAESVKPCKSKNCRLYKTPIKAKYVLEVNAGYATELGLKVGDVATTDYELH